MAQDDSTENMNADGVSDETQDTRNDLNAIMNDIYM